MHMVRCKFLHCMFPFSHLFSGLSFFPWSNKSQSNHNNVFSRLMEIKNNTLLSNACNREQKQTHTYGVRCMSRAAWHVRHSFHETIPKPNTMTMIRQKSISICFPNNWVLNVQFFFTLPTRWSYYSQFINAKILVHIPMKYIQIAQSTVNFAGLMEWKCGLEDTK